MEQLVTINASAKKLTKIRLGVGITMLILAFIGLVLMYITPISPTKYWHYWLAIGPIFAILSLGVSFYLRQQHHIKIDMPTIWHEIVHWLGLMGALLIVNVLVVGGLVGRVQAGLFVLILLAYATFLTGIYLDYMFLVVGFTLALFALLIGLMTEYLSIVLILAAILGGGLLYLITHYHNVKSSKNPS